MSNPAHHAVTNIRYELLLSTRNIIKPFTIRVKDYVNQYNLERIPKMPQFLNTVSAIDIQTKSIPQLSINFILSRRPKNETSPVVLSQMFSFITSDQYNKYVKLFTYGSKAIHGVGSACYSQSSSQIASLPRKAEIYPSLLLSPLSHKYLDENL